MTTQVIVLNGSSSSGKTTIARCLKAILSAPWLSLSIDDLLHALSLSLMDTDAGVAHLQGLPNLERLDLRRTGVTDAGLAHLKGLTKLAVIDLGGTPVTDTGVRELQRALPSSKIIR